MYLVTSRLDPNSYHTVETLRRELNSHLGTAYTSTQPHVTFHAAPSYSNEAQALTLLEKAAHNAYPLQARTDSLGVFTGRNIVLNLPIIRTLSLSRFQWGIWDILSPYADANPAYYHPDEWMPHITLLYKATPEHLSEAVLYFAERPIALEITLSHLRVERRENDGTFTNLFERRFQG